MVGERNKLALMVALGDAAGGVGQDDSLDAERAQHAQGEGDLMRGVALIEMHPPLHDDDRHAVGAPQRRRPVAGDPAEQARDHAAGVALDGGAGEVGNFGVGHDDRLGNRLGDGPQPGAEDDAHARIERAEHNPQERCSFRDLVVVCHF